MSPPKWEELEPAQPDGIVPAWENLELVGAASKSPSALETAAPTFSSLFRGAGLTPEEMSQAYGKAEALVGARGRSFVEGLRSTAELAPATVGAVGGAMLSAPLIPFLGPLAPVGGAAIGAGTGEALKQTGQHLWDRLFGTRAAPQTMRESAERIGGEALMGGAGEMGGAVVTRGIEKAAAPFARRISEGGQRMLDFLREAGTRPAPTDVRRAPLLRRIEGTVSKMFGGGRIAQQGEEELAAVLGRGPEAVPGYAQRRAQELVGGPGLPTPAERGDALVSGMRRMQTEAKDEADIIYGLMRGENLGKPDFTIDKLADAASEALQKSSLRKSFYQRGETSARLRPAGGQYIPSPKGPKIPTYTDEFGDTVYMFDPVTPTPSTLPEPPPGAGFFAGGQVRDPLESKIQAIANMKGRRVPFEEVQVILEELGQLGEKQPVYRFLKGALKDDLKTWAESPGNAPLRDAYVRATDFYKNQVVPFKADQPLGRLVAERAEPVRILNHLLSPNDTNIGGLRAMAAQTEAKGASWVALQEEGMSRAILNPRKAGNIGPESRKVLFTPEQNQFIDDLQNWATLSRAKERAKRGELAFTGQGTVSINQALGALIMIARPLAAAGGAYGAYRGGEFAGYPAVGAFIGGAILIGPNVAARMLTNPTTAKLLSEGLRVPPGTAESARIAAQLIPRYLQAKSQVEP